MHMQKQNNKLPTIWPVSCHTDHIGPGSTFVAIKGFRDDGTRYIAQAIHQGATCIVIEQGTELSHSIHELIKKHAVLLVELPNARQALAQLSAQAHGSPIEQLTLIGITGTKGKTTTAFLVHHLLQQSGINTALISTVHNKIGDTIFEKSLTTPQPDYLHMFFAACVKRGMTHVVMEVAAQAISMSSVSCTDRQSTSFSMISSFKYGSSRLIIHGA